MSFYTYWFALAAVLAGPVLAQDPPAPPGGFPVATLLDQDVTWSDGYRTRFDCYRPDPPALAPATGWPVVIVNHGGGGDRKLPDIRRIGEDLAGAGYVVYAYDHRLKGQTRALNPGWAAPITLERILLDQAESLTEAMQLLPGLIDRNRLAVTGFSGGGRKSFSAAAWSERPLPLQSAVATHHPRVLAIATEIAQIDSAEGSAEGGVLAYDHAIDGRSPTDPALLALQAGDYATWSGLMQNDYNLDLLQNLRTSEVPMLGMWAMQDIKIKSNLAIDVFQDLPARKRLFLSTGGHSTVKTDHERAMMLDLRRRWFDRFLKFVPNGAALEPYLEVAAQPPTDAAHADPAAIWEHRNANAWGQVPSTRMFLRGGGALANDAPAGPELAPLLQHRVQPGFDVVDYVQQGSGLAPGRLLTRIPRVIATFESAPLGDTRELFGRTQVELFVDDTTGLFQLTALLVHVDPAGAEHWITMGTQGIRDVAGRHVLQIDLDDVAHVIPAGNRLRLHVLNLADHAPPGGDRRIRVVPYFTDTATQIVIDPNAASFVDLPLRAYRANLAPRFASQSAALGIQHRLRLSAGPSRAGLPYAVFVGTSGEAPGLSIGTHIPLNLDAWTSLGIAFQNTALFPQMVGVLGGDGIAHPGVFAPNPAIANVLSGLRFTAVGLVLNGFSIDAVTNAASLVIQP